jgi:replicative DNA helicase
LFIDTEILEKAILGCIMINGALFKEAITAQLEPSDFRYDVCQDIFKAMVELDSRGRSIDAVLVIYEIAKRCHHEYISEEDILKIACESPGLELFDEYVDELIQCRGDENSSKLNLVEGNDV